MDDIEAEAYRLLVEPTPPRDSRPASKMKPNTRFLRHIVRNANSHNAALLAKETADSQRRLKDLMRKDGGGDDQDDDDDSSSKSHDRHDRDSGRKRSESSKDGESRLSRRNDRDRDDRESHGDKSSRSHRHQSDREDRKDRDDRDDRDRPHRSHRSHRDTHSRSRERHERHRSSKHRRRSESPEAAREGRLSPPSERRYRDRSPHRKHRSGHHDDKESTSQRSSDRDQRKKDSEKERTSAHSSRKGRNSKRDKSSSRSRSRSRSCSESEGYSTSDSDPLDEIVGPRLASDSLGKEKDRVRIKGRGAFSSVALGGPGSSIDRHFASDYDPSNDVEMQDEAQATPAQRPSVRPRPSSAAEDAQTEMQRDRKQLLRDGAERLRAAGFTDREVAIWARGGRREVAPRDAAPKAKEAASTKDTKDEANAPWAKKGEAREWDRGKEADDDGPAKPIWAR